MLDTTLGRTDHQNSSRSHCRDCPCCRTSPCHH